MKNPTIEEVKARQAEVAETIQELLNNFQDETGTQVEGIDFEKIQALGKPAKIECLKLQIEIK